MPTDTIGAPAIPLCEQLAEAQKQLEEAIATFAPGEWSEPATPHGRVLRDHLTCLTQKMGAAIKRSGVVADQATVARLPLPEVGTSLGAADLFCAFYRMEHLARRVLTLYESYGLAVPPEVYDQWVPIIGLYRHCTGAIRQQSRDPARHTDLNDERGPRGNSLKR